jgi:RNA polymerase sigma-B factor
VQNSAEDVGAGFNAASQQRRLLPLVDDLVSQDADHCRDLEQRENRLKLAEALQGLPSQERVALMEVILQGQSLRDVARRTGVSAMTIQRRVKRGLIRLRHQLTAQFELA